MNEIHRINPPSSVVLSERKYPVITNNPSWSQICEWGGRSRPQALPAQQGHGGALTAAAACLLLSPPGSRVPAV